MHFPTCNKTFYTQGKEAYSSGGDHSYAFKLETTLFLRIGTILLPMHYKTAVLLLPGKRKKCGVFFHNKKVLNSHTSEVS